MSRVHDPRMFFTIAVGALALLTAPAARAQSVAQPNTWTVTGYLGGSAGLNAPDAGNSLSLGIAGGYDLTPNIGFEGELGHLFDVAGDDPTLDWSVTNVSANFLYHFDVRTVTPYATFGIGFEHSSVDVKDVAIPEIGGSTTEVSFNLGGGVKYPLTPRLLLRGDLRRFQSNDLAPDYWRLYAGLTYGLGR